MRRLFILLAILTLPVIAWAGEKSFTTKVSGNCGSCKKRIEKTVNKIDGVAESEWDKKAKTLTVKYDDAKTNEKTIKHAVWAVGYDVEGMEPAPTEAYNKLPDCCKYRDTTHE
jgi:copper chaperone CopZ